MDSGGNQHITFTDKHLTNVIEVSMFKIHVGHPNDIVAYIHKIGNLKLTPYLNLYDVLVIREYCVSLIFVQKIDRDSNMFVGLMKCNDVYCIRI